MTDEQRKRVQEIIANCYWEPFAITKLTNAMLAFADECVKAERTEAINAVAQASPSVATTDSESDSAVVPAAAAPNPQPSTATLPSAPSQEGVGQGGAADASALEPCPFCKSTDALGVFDSDHENDCEHCYGAHTQTFGVVCNVNNGGCGASGGYMKTRKDAIEKWNRRTP